MKCLFGCNMLRLTIFLCGGLFLVLLIAGEDNGQVRQGLLTPPVTAEYTLPEVTPVPAATPEPQVSEAVFIPAQPVRPVRVDPEPQQVAAVEPQQVADVQLVEAEPAGRLAVVTARSVNVRSGPSTGNQVIGRLTQDEQVLVVFEPSPVPGWSLVRIEGDGIEGYVATRLLSELTP